MKRIILLLSALLTTSLVVANAPQATHHWANTQFINSDWLYLERNESQIPSAPDSAYEQIELPHTWNAVDAVTEFDYRQEGSWYRKHLAFDSSELDVRHYLRFGAAGQEAKVYVNGEELTHHIGGYSAFTCEITDVIKVGDNVVDVWVNNSCEPYRAPQKADFNFYGGLYRSVELIKAPQISLSRKFHGGPGLRVWSDSVSGKMATLEIRAQVDNGTQSTSEIELVATLKDAKGRIISQGSTTTSIKADANNEIEFSLPDVSRPNLWSPEDPYLYSLDVELFQGGELIDQIAVRHGFRFFEFTADNGFFLNGKPYKLHGISRHQDYANKGNALSYEDHYNDLVLMKEAGINWLRMAHYQQDDYILALCDQMGILTWEEIPWVGATPQAPLFAASLESMLKELIEQHYNNTSIILWGMGNEVWMSDRGDGKANIYDLVSHLNDFIHSEDPTRKTVFVNGDNTRIIEYKVWEIPDVMGYNLYRGWYQQGYDSLGEHITMLHGMMPGKPLLLSEFGAGSDLMVHSETPTRQDFSIEYQNDFLESHLLQIQDLDWLCGFNRWSFADFGAAHRGDTKPHINQKGLVTFDREKKDAFYIFKSFYSDDPVLQIESPTWVQRVGSPEKKYRVFTNMKSVELFHNGSSLGSKKSGFEWDVTLTEGENRLLAKGKSGKERRECSVTLNYQNRVNDFAVSSSKTEEPSNPSSKAIDGDTKSYYTASTGVYLLLDTKKISILDGITISLFEANNSSMAIEISSSADGSEWQMQYSGNTNQRTDSETFIFKKQAETRYIKITNLGDASGNAKDLNIREITPMISFEKNEKNLYEIIGAGGQ